MEERSPYTPPVSDVEVVAERKGAAWKAVLIGELVDIGGTVLLSYIESTVAFVMMRNRGLDDAEFLKMFDDPLSPLLLTMTLTGILLSILGGFVCARIARHNEFKLAGVMVLISTLFSIAVGNKELTAYYVSMYAATVISVFFGSWLGLKLNQRRRGKRLVK